MKPIVFDWDANGYPRVDHDAEAAAAYHTEPARSARWLRQHLNDPRRGAVPASTVEQHIRNVLDGYEQATGQ